MERVETLLEKLNDQVKQGAAASKLLLTVQMLQHELISLQQQEPEADIPMVAVNIPFTPAAVQPANIEREEVVTAEPQLAEITTVAPEEKIVEVLQIDEAEVEAELEEMKRNAALLQQISNKSKPQLVFNMQDDDIPTLAQQPVKPVPQPAEVNDSIAAEEASINDKLKSTATEVSHKLTEAPVKDLKKAIGINDRFLYINELFRGDEAMYERSIKTINGFSIYPEAEYWIRRELKTKLGWNDKDETVLQFDQLVKRRFS